MRFGRSVLSFGLLAVIVCLNGNHYSYSQTNRKKNCRT